LAIPLHNLVFADLFAFQRRMIVKRI